MIGHSVQGVETPVEQALTTNQRCGQAATTSFYIERSPAEQESRPCGAAVQEEDWGNNQILNSADWVSSWVWRRSVCSQPTNLTLCPVDGFWSPSKAVYVNQGDISQQDKGNALTSGYFLLDTDAVQQQLSEQGAWKGGVNLTVLKMLEQRSYDWFRYVQSTSHLVGTSYELRISTNTSGTLHGLSKWPYLRDSRRSSSGIGGFRLQFNATIDFHNASAPALGYRFHDAVALANAFVHSYQLLDDPECATPGAYPAYLSDNQTKPFWIPLRALTVETAPNLLVCGKTMSQTAHANDATRKHTGEWSSGVAAGGVAVLMARHGWSSTDAYNNVQTVQSFLNSTVVGQPLEWDLN
eukprot:TRINITY_DN44453_c0_g1_i1.p1 TRINITY_DN44453_c0_g1~~TRINITY_DN44453_c0_g1_i1.p1  ORF type:complete len:353 (+),score=49.04 TRINITY_DN44453_c0_g1_i1:180-1238(+)